MLLDTILKYSDLLGIPGKLALLLAFSLILWRIFQFVNETNATNKSQTELKKQIQILPQLKQKIDMVWDVVVKGKSIDSKVEVSDSPLRPTKYGSKLIKDSGLELYLDNNKDKLFTFLKAELPNNYSEYDVQESARSTMLLMHDDSEIKSVKDYTYKNGKDLFTILKIGGLWLRDDFLGEERKTSSK